MATTMFAVVCQYDYLEFVPTGVSMYLPSKGEPWTMDDKGNVIWGQYKPAVGEMGQGGFKTREEAQEYIKERSQITNYEGKKEYRNFIIIEYKKGDSTWWHDLKQYYHTENT